MGFEGRVDFILAKLSSDEEELSYDWQLMQGVQSESGSGFPFSFSIVSLLDLWSHIYIYIFYKKTSPIPGMSTGAFSFWSLCQAYFQFFLIFFFSRRMKRMARSGPLILMLRERGLLLTCFPKCVYIYIYISIVEVQANRWKVSAREAFSRPCQAHC